jgi:hypothetical protein
MDHGIHGRPCCVNGGVNEAFEKDSRTVRHNEFTVEVKLPNVRFSHETGSKALRHQESVGLCGMSRADVAERIEHTMPKKDAIRLR